MKNIKMERLYEPRFMIFRHCCSNLNINAAINYTVSIFISKVLRDEMRKASSKRSEVHFCSPPPPQWSTDSDNMRNLTIINLKHFGYSVNLATHILNLRLAFIISNITRLSPLLDEYYWLFRNNPKMNSDT